MGTVLIATCVVLTYVGKCSGAAYFMEDMSGIILIRGFIKDETMFLLVLPWFGSVRLRCGSGSGAENSAWFFKPSRPERLRVGSAQF